MKKRQRKLILTGFKINKITKKIFFNVELNLNCLKYIQLYFYLIIHFA